MKEKENRPAPVETGFDPRSWQRQHRDAPEDAVQAPDGISGDWQ